MSRCEGILVRMSKSRGHSLFLAFLSSVTQHRSLSIGGLARALAKPGAPAIAATHSSLSSVTKIMFAGSCHEPLALHHCCQCCHCICSLSTRVAMLGTPPSRGAFPPGFSSRNERRAQLSAALARTGTFPNSCRCDVCPIPARKPWASRPMSLPHCPRRTAQPGLGSSWQGLTPPHVHLTFASVGDHRKLMAPPGWSWQSLAHPRVLENVAAERPPCLLDRRPFRVLSRPTTARKPSGPRTVPRPLRGKPGAPKRSNAGGARRPSRMCTRDVCRSAQCTRCACAEKKSQCWITLEPKCHVNTPARMPHL